MGNRRDGVSSDVIKQLGLNKRVPVSIHDRVARGMSPLEIDPIQAAENTKKLLFDLNGAGITKDQRKFGEQVLNVWSDRKTPASAASWMLLGEQQQAWYLSLTPNPGSVILAYAGIVDCLDPGMRMHQIGDYYSADRQNAVRATGQQLAIACGSVANLVALDQLRLSNAG
jgi:hypothetical protein